MKLALTIALTLLTGMALANGISNDIGQNIGGGISQFDNGISTSLVAAAAPPACSQDGTLDYSNGCDTVYHTGMFQ